MAWPRYNSDWNFTGKSGYCWNGVEIAGTSLSHGTGADVTSTLAKATDAALRQARFTAVNVISGRVLNSLTAKAVTRTGFSACPFFRSAQTGQFISNAKGFTITVVSDATKVATGLGY